MKTIAPNYYKEFKCIADKCNHTCCVGWEIDIDDDTYNKYKNINTDFGKKLNSNIDFNGECASFKLLKDERCPFLNENNLCEIILELGEDALCQICSDHPRFRNFYSDKTEIGLGICCEEAARIIINNPLPFVLAQIDDDGNFDLIYEDEVDFFEKRNSIFKIIKEENSFETICKKILSIFNIDFPQKSLYEWVDIFLKLEMLNENWGNLLQRLKSEEIFEFKNEKALKNLLIYFIYRHLGESVYDGNFKGRLLFAILSCKIISALCGLNISVEETAVMYSSEIEYSDENMNFLIELLQNESPE